MVASGGIGRNLDLVRTNWPDGYGDPQRRLSGVPDFVCGSMLPVGSARAVG